MNYLQGAVQLDGEDEDGNYVYKYVGLKRSDPASKTPPNTPTDETPQK